MMKEEAQINSSFRILLPQTSPNTLDFDIANMKLRNWVVPGETILIFIEISGSIDDEISFHCIASDSEHTQPFSYGSDTLIQQSITHCQVFQNLSSFEQDILSCPCKSSEFESRKVYYFCFLLRHFNTSYFYNLQLRKTF